MPKLGTVSESGDSVDAAHDIKDARELLDCAIKMAQIGHGSGDGHSQCGISTATYHILREVRQKISAAENYIHHSQHE